MALLSEMLTSHGNGNDDVDKKAHFGESTGLAYFGLIQN